jgi:macrolide transport system ATP-binding/permease protein
MSDALLELRGAVRRYDFGGQEVYALRGVDLDIEAGEMVALMGASGSGKSTLMNVLGCLDRLDQGTYRVHGDDVSLFDADRLATLRRTYFGFVFQRYNLLPQLTAVTNVEIPAIYAGLAPDARHTRALSLLSRLGLGERVDYRPSQLSGGQQQRVSIARALMNGGAVILADEPTGALDSQTGREVMALLVELNRLGHTVIIATHDAAIAAHTHRILEIADGRIVAERSSGAVTRKNAAAGLDAVIKSAHIEQTKGPEDAAANRPGLPSAVIQGNVVESIGMAIHALFSHRLRTALTLLGVVIGIVSVVTMVALGEAAQRVLALELMGLSRDTLEVSPGKDWGDPDASRIQTLVNADVEACDSRPLSERRVRRSP